MCSAKGHVRFTPKSGHVRCTGRCPLSANSGHRANLFDHFVSAGEERSWHCEAKGFGCFEIDHQLKARGLLDRYNPRFLTLQNLVNEYCALPKHIGSTGAVRHQTTGFGKRPRERRRWQPMLERKLRCVFRCQTALHNDSARSFLFHRRKCCIDLTGCTHHDGRGNLDACNLPRTLDVLKKRLRGGVGTVAEGSHAMYRGKHIVEQFNAFAVHFQCQQRYAGNIPARAS